MAEIESKILLGIVGLITTVYGWLFRYLFGKVQFKDTCVATHKGLDDCIEAEERRNRERYEALIKSIDELKQLVRNARK